MAGEQLDLSSSADDDSRRPGGTSDPRPFLGVHFRCCDVYARIYLARERAAYQGHCPRCLRPLLVRIGPHGSDARFFEAG